MLNFVKGSQNGEMNLNQNLLSPLQNEMMPSLVEGDEDSRDLETGTQQVRSKDNDNNAAKAGSKESKLIS